MPRLYYGTSGPCLEGFVGPRLWSREYRLVTRTQVSRWELIIGLFESKLPLVAYTSAPSTKYAPCETDSLSEDPSVADADYGFYLARKDQELATSASVLASGGRIFERSSQCQSR
jgi:hypothetical protein